MRTAEQVVAALRARGELWEPARGLVALRGDTFALFSRIERLVASATADIGADCDAECDAWSSPAALPLATLARASYFDAFPQWLTLASHLREDAETLERVARSADPAADACEACAPAGAALPPAVCYHVYAALANRDKGIVTVSIGGDGDLMYAPGVLWTAAHHKIPILMIIHNNRAYHQEVMHLQKMASLHNRRMDTAAIGTTIENPNIDFAKLAQSLGLHGEGPISDPNAIGPALSRALAVVKRGEPALGLVEISLELRRR